MGILVQNLGNYRALYAQEFRDLFAQAVAAARMAMDPILEVFPVIQIIVYLRHRKSPKDVSELYRFS